tara:strand:+ start:4065 stop:6491 length:2427 start_codon:yes stop_codon:yes gene_type:complete
MPLSQFSRSSLAVFLATPLTFSVTQSQAQEESALALEEVVVVAQRREQSAMVVPVAVDVFSAKDIIDTGALTLKNIDDYIPGFEVLGESATQQGLKVRGVSSSNISTGGDPSVATFYDETYLPRAATTVAFADMQRVEVLKGPQGTLFGRNAAVGVISMIPNSPSNELEGFGRARLGNDELVRLEGMVNVPVTDSFFLRVNALSNQWDGFADQLGPAEHDPGEQDHKTARIAGLWEISDATRAQLSYDWDKVDNAPGMAFGYSEYAYSLDPFSGKVENDVIDGEETRDMDAVIGKLWHDFSPELAGKLILSYRDFDTSNRGDVDGTADVTRYLDADNREDSDIFYSELQFNYSDENVDIVFGANYSQEDTHQTTWLTATADSVARQVTGVMNDVIGLEPPMDHLWNSQDYARALQSLGLMVTPEEIEQSGDFWYEEISAALGEPMIYGPSLAGILWRERIENEGDFTNWGVYFDADYSLNERIKLTAGLRYSQDDKKFSWLIPLNTFREVRPGVPNQIFTLPDGLESAAETPLEAEDSWSKTTGRLVAQYQVTDLLMTYLSYSTGYKSGGYDTLDIETAFTPFEPEESTMYEWGIKGDLFDGTLRAQVAVFRLEIDNRQRSVESKPPGQDAAIPKVINGNQTFDGIELTLDWLPLDTLRLGLVTTYRDQESEWNAFYNSTGELTEDRSKGDTNNNFTLTADWTPAIPRGNLTVHVDYVYRENARSESDSDYYPDLDDLPGYFDDEKYLNGRIAWDDERRNWEFAVWGKNLTDEEYIVDMRNTTRSEFGTPVAAISLPRSYGIEVAYTY